MSAYSALATSAWAKRSERRDRAGVDHQAGALGRVERVDHDRRRAGRPSSSERVFVELDAEHRRGREHLGAGCADRVDAASTRRRAGSPAPSRGRSRIRSSAGSAATRTADCPRSARAAPRRRAGASGPFADGTVRRDQLVELVRGRARRALSASARRVRVGQRAGAALRTRARPGRGCSATRSTGASASARARCRSSNSAVGSAHWRSSSIRTSGRAAAMRRNRSAAASNVEEPLGRVVGRGGRRRRSRHATRERGADAHQLAAAPRDVLVQRARSARARRTHASTLRNGCSDAPRLVAPAVHDRGAARRRDVLGEAAEERGLADTGLTARPSRSAGPTPAHAASSRGELRQLVDRGRRTRPRAPTQLGSGKSTASCSAAGSRAVLASAAVVDAVPAGRAPVARCERRRATDRCRTPRPAGSVVLERAQRVGLAPRARERADQQPARAIAVGVPRDLRFEQRDRVGGSPRPRSARRRDRRRSRHGSRSGARSRRRAHSSPANSSSAGPFHSASARCNTRRCGRRLRPRPRRRGRTATRRRRRRARSRCSRSRASRRRPSPAHATPRCAARRGTSRARRPATPRAAGAARAAPGSRAAGAGSHSGDRRWCRRPRPRRRRPAHARS